MKIVLLSGGSGKRLWPLSNDTRSKQFLRLLPNDNGSLESMVQRVFGQIQQNCKGAEVLIATGMSQVDSIKSQLGNAVSIVTEPMRRDTFPAIALACSYLKDEMDTDPMETVIVLPVDPYADSEYFKLLLEMDAAVQSNASDLVLMGIKPTYPSAKYGYIMPQSGPEPKPVQRFIEKPTEQDAAKYIKDGAVWNGGVFAFKLQYLLNLIKKETPFTSFDELRDGYGEMPKISFDYAVVEKAKSISMLSYKGQWKDLGTWNTITEQMNSECVGKAYMTETCKGTHVVNELDIPVVALGLQNVVVAASPDGILVSDKRQSSYIKPIVDTFTQRPMYEERRWGEYKILDYSSYPDHKHSLIKEIHMKAGKCNSYQSHHLRDEIWTIIDGTGVLVIDGHTRNVRRGDVAYVTKEQKHAISATTDLKFIEVQIGEEISDSDVEHYEFNW